MSNSNKPISHGFTLRTNGIARMIAMDIVITDVNSTAKIIQTKGIWDTGATGTVITQKIVDALGLTPTGMTNVNTASETGKPTYTYLVDVFLKQDVRIAGVVVTCGTIDTNNGLDCLIGMDIIALGDFSITNHQGKTCMSFRLPSQHEIDYVQMIDKQKEREANPKAHSNHQPPKKKRKKR